MFESRKSTLLLAFMSLAGLAATSLKADIIGFRGPWDPVDPLGNLINYGNPGNTGAYSLSISPDFASLTINFSDERGSESVFTNFLDDSLLPSGTVSFNWSVTYQESADWLME